MFTPIQTDTVVEKLTAMAYTDAMLGDADRVEVLRAMIEAYMYGFVDITFDDNDEPIATLIEHSVPIVHAPLFPPMPSFTSDGDAPIKNKIGFKYN